MENQENMQSRYLQEVAEIIVKGVGGSVESKVKAFDDIAKLIPKWIYQAGRKNISYDN
jgi:hypothetical protein